MRNYITTATTVTSELAEIRAKLALLERADEDNAEAVNDLSEDMRKELDNIYEAIQSKIYEIRGQRVMLDRDLAELYGVTTGNLNKAVKRNIERFPERFMFQLTEQEFLIFQNGTSSWGGTRKRPYAFTEQGVSMLSAVLRSPTAIQVSIRIMDAFVAMRNYIMTTSTMTAELSEIRAKLTLLERADEDNAEAVNDLSEDMRKELDNIYEAIAALSVKVPKARKQPRPIGFKQSK